MRISDWSSDVCSSDLFDLDPLFGQCRRCAHCMTHHHTDRDHRDIATLALHRSLPERHDMIAIGHFSLLAAAAGGQQEEDRILLADAGLQARQSVVSGKSGSVRVDLGGLRIIKKKNKY